MPRKKGIPRIRLKARIASKVMEKDLMGKAKMLMDDPELILPECASDCGACPFKKTRARLARISKFKDNPAKLAKFARRGDKLARAYAATIGLVHEEKTPYLATATYPAGTISYALRGKTPREKLIGVQYFDSPKWRVLGVLDLVKKRGLHFYSYGESFVCTGREAKPPAEYVKSAAESIGASKLDGDTYTCPHSPASTRHIEFDWVSAGKKILVCEQCAVKTKNTLKKLAEGMAVPRVLNEFDISIISPLKNDSGKETNKGGLTRRISDDLLEKYSAGQIGDRELVDKHLAEVKEKLSEEQRKLFIRGDRSFGEDLRAFVEDITEDDAERKALTGLLSNVENPVVLDESDTVNRLLSMFWSDHGKEALEAVVGDELAQKHFKDEDDARKSPLKTLREAIQDYEHSTASARIPRYAKLSTYGSFADKVVRAYKTRGQSGAIAVLDGDTSNDHRIRSISHAFYLALGVSTKSWKFTDEEREYGKHLETFAKRLLGSEDSETHHQAFQELMSQAGSSEDLRLL